MPSNLSSGVHFDASVWESLVELTGGSPELLIELIDNYLESSPPRLERLKVAVAAASNRAIEFESHALKSSAAALGLMRLNQLCIDMEAAGRESRAKAAAELLAPLASEFDLSLRELQRMRGQLAQAA